MATVDATGGCPSPWHSAPKNFRMGTVYSPTEGLGHLIWGEAYATGLVAGIHGGLQTAKGTIRECVRREFIGGRHGARKVLRIWILGLEPTVAAAAAAAAAVSPE